MAPGFALARLRVTLGRLCAQRCFFLFLAQLALIGGTPRDLDGADLLYFSFTVLTSTGFGDIVPAQHPAKTVVVFQQIVGTLYVAILIARLIDAYPSRRDDDAT